MKTAVRINYVLIIGLVLLLAAGAGLFWWLSQPEPVDPHEGQVLINDGFHLVWLTPLETVEASKLSLPQFRIMDGHPYYTGDDYEIRRGIDVSEHQQEIDWEVAANSGIDYAYVRVAYRGYSEGGLFEDPYYRENLKGARDNGLDVGAYVFSQAVTPEEAEEEAEMAIRLLEGYEITLPVMFDWEKIDGGGARTDEMDSAVLTECAEAFCRTIREAGYEPGIYFNRNLGYYGYDLSRLAGYSFWIAVPGEFPDFYYASDMWQYSFNAEVPGIEGATDMNLMFVPKQAPAEASAGTGPESTPEPEGEPE